MHRPGLFRHLADGQGGLTLTNDTDPAGGVRSSTTSQVQMTSKNIGDLLNAASIPWGNFYGGFNLQTINANGSTGCHRTTVAQVTRPTLVRPRPRRSATRLSRAPRRLIRPTIQRRPLAGAVFADGQTPDSRAERTGQTAATSGGRSLHLMLMHWGR
jgi:hypothetical protein